MKRFIFSLLGGLVLALASSVLSSTKNVANVPRDACAETLCPVVVAGWPFPYLYDDKGFSPVNSADLGGWLVGSDSFYIGPFLINVLIFTLILFGLTFFIKRMRHKT